MPKVRDIYNYLSADDRKELARLEAEMDGVLDQLFDNPSNALLASRLSEIEIAIVRITREKTIDY